MKRTIPQWVSGHLLVRKGSRTWPPGGGAARTWKDPDGTVCTLVSQGETFDVYIGRERFLNVTLSARTLVSLAWWLIAWRIFTVWFGLKLWLWNWSLSKQMDGLRDEEAPTIPGSGNMGGPPSIP